MTRPGLVRADTIDLQNQDAPTTQDHHSTSLQPSDVGKHQASEIRHVREERHEEEEHLQDAWTRAHQDVQVNELTDDQLQAHNHENGDSTDDSELDDDMLDDRISSSPSIDDDGHDDEDDLFQEPIATQDEYLDYNFSHDDLVEALTAIPEEKDEDELDMNGLFLHDRASTSNQTPISRTISPSSWSTVSDASASSVLEDLESHDKHDDDDDDLDLSFYSDGRFVDSGWGGECLRETEDIDFDFVYALHTFVATVEGQANAGKGDTMVLLDDSNSYWWLVRIVKDNSIG
ncbi:hypothetical protein KCU98_g19451, partial [Aureobasidium melanogenum]